jgi:hypothetical protein
VYFIFVVHVPVTLSAASKGIAANGLRIGDGGAFKKRQPNICTNAQ